MQKVSSFSALGRWPLNPNPSDASIEQCRHEVSVVEQLFEREGIPYLSTTHTSIEEIASKVMQSLGMNRQMY